MPTTIRGEAVQLTKQDDKVLDTKMRVYNSAKRTAFNRYNDNLISEDRLIDNLLKKQIMSTFNINAREAYSTMVEGKEVVSSQKALLPEYVKDTKSKIDKSKYKLKKVEKSLKNQLKKIEPDQQKISKLERAIKGINSRIKKFEKKYNFYKKHQKAGTIPHIIFGGKQEFHKMKDADLTPEERKLANKEWKESRSNNYYSIGAKIDGGNQNLRITAEESYNEDGLFDLRMNVAERRWQNLKAWFPAKFHEAIFEAICYYPYSVRIKRENGRVYIFVTYDTKETNVGYVKNGIAGIDLNTDHIAATIVSSDGNFKTSKIFPLTHLDSFRTDRKDWLIGNIIKEVIDWIKSFDISVVAIENLKFAKRHDTNKKFNRKTCMFAYSQMIAYITSRCYKENIELRVIDPHFTSLIGKYKYADMYGLSTHESAALVIARRGLGFVEKPSKQLFIAVKTALLQESRPMEGKSFWSCLYGINKRDSNRVLEVVRTMNDDCTTGNLSPPEVIRPDVRIVTLPGMTVKPVLIH